MTLRTLFQATLLCIASVPFLAGASIGDSAIKTWNSPLPSGVYDFGDEIVYSGSVELPADWMGQVRVYRDGVRLTDHDQAFFNFNAPTTTFNYLANTGVWTAGAHQVEVRFDGAAECRLVCTDSDLTCQNTVNMDGDPNNDWCPRTVDNQVLDQRYPTRNISIGPPSVPELGVAPNPAHFWNHVVSGPEDTLTVSLTNTGAPGTVATGNASRVSGAMFSCVSGCSYAISPGQTHAMTLRFTPPATASTWYGVFQLSCAGCLASSVTLNVDGVTSAALDPSEIEPWPSSLDFGVVNLGQYSEKDLWVTNIGGTVMSGTVTFNDPQIECEDTCDFVLNADEYVRKRVYYTPTIAGVLSGVSATITGSGGASPVVVPIQAEGNDKPRMVIWSDYTWSEVEDGDEIVVEGLNPGTSGQVYFAMENSGAGVLRGKIDPMAAGDGSIVCNYGCDTESNLRNRYETGDITVVELSLEAPLDGSERSAVLKFSDVTPGGTAVVDITVRLVPNTDPIGATPGCYLNFGNVLVGQSTLPITTFDATQSDCEITNIGVGSLEVNLPDFTRNGTGRYECVTGPGYSCGTFFLSGGETARFTYRFTALAPEPDEYMHDWYPISAVPLGGFSYGSNVHFHAQSMSIDLDVHPDSDPEYDFGIVNVGAESAEKYYQLSVTHIGGWENNWFSYPFPGEVNYSVRDSAHFVCTQNCTGTLKPSGPTQSTMATIVFRPGADVGVINEDVTIDYDFGSWVPPVAPSPITLSLTGEGNDKPRLLVYGVTSIPVVDFGIANVSEVKEVDLMLKNIGLGTLTGEFLGAFPAPFSCAAPTCDAFSLPPGDETMVRLRFTPSSDVFYEETVTIRTNNGDQILTLRGSGKNEPQLTVSTNYINFDTLTDPATQTDVGDINETTFRVTNSGRGTMSGTLYLTDPTSHFLFSTQNISLDEGESADIPVQFAPLIDSTALSAEITIEANDGTPGGWTDSKKIALSGTGSFAALFDPRGINSNFGPVIFGKDKELTSNLRNNGSRPLGQGILEFPPGSPFTCISPIGPSGKCEYDIGAGGEQQVVIRFTPQGLGQVVGEMSLSSIPGFTIDFTGNGIPPRFNYIER